MNPEQFDVIVWETADAMPVWVHDALENIDILIVDEPDEELGPETRNLLGLHPGLPLPERGADYTGELPDVIYISRRLVYPLPVSAVPPVPGASVTIVPCCHS